MAATVGSLFADAQHLSASDRWHLVDLLIESVDGAAESPLHPSWEPEILRRVAELDAGSVTTVPWSEVYSQAVASLSGNGDA